jgi:hypothetical protein
MTRQEETKGAWLINGTEMAPKKSMLLEVLQQLKPETIADLREMLGWETCYDIYNLCRWFRENFHPSKLSEQAGVLGVLEAERNYGRRGSEDSGTSKPKKSNAKVPSWLGCYHCYMLKPFHFFELFRYSPEDEADEGDTTTRHSTPTTKRDPSSSSPPSTATSLPPVSDNPHYAPNLTRSSLMEEAARNGRRAGQGACCKPSRRVKDTHGLRRFCVECGVKKRIYKPLDVIDLQKAEKGNETLWVCQCRKLLRRAGDEVRCQDCGSCAPLSAPSEY